MTKVYYFDSYVELKRQALDALDKLLESRGDLKRALDRLGVSIMTARRLAFCLEDMEVFPETEFIDVEDMSDQKRKACLITFSRFSDSFWNGIGDLMKASCIDVMTDELTAPPNYKLFDLRTSNYMGLDIGSYLIDNMTFGFSLGVSPYISRKIKLSGRLHVDDDWPYSGQDAFDLISNTDDALLKRLLHSVNDLAINVCLATLYMANTSEIALKFACDAIDCFSLEDLTETLKDTCHVLEAGKEICDRVYSCSFLLSDYDTGEIINRYDTIHGEFINFEYKHISDELDRIRWSQVF